MSLTSESMTPADIAAVTGNCGGNGMWGDGGAWWIIILFLFVFCGWGGNGWGNNGGAAGAADNYVLASDFATLQRQIDSSTASLERKSDAINSGLCDGFYAQNTTALTGFSNVNQNLCNGFAQAELSRANGHDELEEKLGYSESGRYPRYSRDGEPDGGSSYGRHYVRAHYSRDGRGRYSMDEGHTMLADQIRDMIDNSDLSQSQKGALRKVMEALQE